MRLHRTLPQPNKRRHECPRLFIRWRLVKTNASLHSFLCEEEDRGKCVIIYYAFFIKTLTKTPFMKKKTLKKPLTFLDKGSRIYRAKTI